MNSTDKSSPGHICVIQFRRVVVDFSTEPIRPALIHARDSHVFV